jgi:hypothetical protein
MKCPVNGCLREWEMVGRHPFKRVRELLRRHLLNGHGIHGRPLAVMVSGTVTKLRGA